VVCVAALVLTAGILVGLTRGDAGPPVGQLRIERTTWSAVTLDWQAPAGATAATYRISRDGAQIATADTTSYTDRSVAPGTRYRYEVVAVGDGSTSAAATVTVRTPVPPVSLAVLGGPYRVALSVTSAQGWESITAGDRDTATWSFTGTGSRLHGAAIGGAWTMTLRREGASASGTARETLSSCNFTPVTDTITVRVRVLAGRVIGGEWIATRFAGTFRDVSPAASSGLYTCSGSSYTARIDGVRR
jgi:hypothetical protein